MNQPQNILTYNEESGVKAGGGEYVSEGGPYVCKITEAKYVKAKTGSAGIEFSIVAKEGLKCNYLTVYYAKEDGTVITGGSSVINAFMGLLGLKGITSAKKSDAWHCPEFEGKTIGLFLSKRLYTKNQGGDGYEFSIRAPFNPMTSQTLKEAVANQPAQAIERWQASYVDRDERGRNGPAQGGGQDEYFQSSGSGSDPFADIPGNF